MSFLQDLEHDYRDFERAGAEKIEIGRTVLGNTIYAFFVGCGEPKIIVQYAIHAREFITYYLARAQIMDALKNLSTGAGTICFVPIVNIDGVALVLDGLDSAFGPYVPMLKHLVPSGDFSLYKANIRGVDLNVNFDARWGTGKQNVSSPGSANFIGEYPNSEPETLSLIELTQKFRPNLTVSYHSKGEVIYYDFHQSFFNRIRDYHIARVASRATGYKLAKTGASAGGYKDWCILKHKIPALTIEVGSDTLAHPIGLDKLPSIYQKNAKVLFNLLDYLAKN